MSTTLAPTLSARLSLTPKSTLSGVLDGAWWPRSRDLTAEIPALVDALEGPYGRITRVTVNPTRWPVVPHKVAVTGHTVHVGWFTEQDPDKMILLSYSVGRCDLLVIPPDTEPAAAARLMTAAALPGSVLAAGALMSDEAAIGRRMRDAHSSESTWETDGGAATLSPPRPPVAGSRMIPLPTNRRR
ncbi:DUF5994 family protein [Streptomyces sp. TX20-6-3]|uniref:DUF5994 family protein n=1 Tax=Streptomyces sp. TX20-6-3 TaxID=3028705 RepID=UPI0029B4DFF5|nr:DUF5994 family protein [Streptomyces sp. TX20-6-3]MDX2562885.1 DUF5994 family protein [Streptomyces sp. TX20-6-3]